MSEMTELAERLRKCGEWLSLCCEAAAAIERLDHECQASMATIASERARAEAAEAEASRLRTENEKLREALTPFAEMASDYDPEEGDDADLAWFEHPKVGDLRRARAALEGKE